MDVHRHAAAVVRHDKELSLCSVTLISFAWPPSASSTRVVDDFVREMIRTRGVGVHARAATHGLETGQDFDVGCVVRHSLPLTKRLRAACQSRAARSLPANSRAGEPRIPALRGIQEFGTQPTTERREHQSEDQRDDGDGLSRELEDFRTSSRGNFRQRQRSLDTPEKDSAARRIHDEHRSDRDADEIDDEQPARRRTVRWTRHRHADCRALLHARYAPRLRRRSGRSSCGTFTWFAKRAIELGFNVEFAVMIRSPTSRPPGRRVSCGPGAAALSLYPWAWTEARRLLHSCDLPDKKGLRRGDRVPAIAPAASPRRIRRLPGWLFPMPAWPRPKTIGSPSSSAASAKSSRGTSRRSRSMAVRQVLRAMVYSQVDSGCATIEFWQCLPGLHENRLRTGPPPARHCARWKRRGA